MEEIVADFPAWPGRAGHKPLLRHQRAADRENLITMPSAGPIRLREAEVVPRISDLAHLTSSMKGKIEWISASRKKSTC